MVHPEIQLTTREKIQFLWLIPLILFKTALTLIFAVLTDTAAAIKHPVRTIGVNLLRHATLTLSFRQKLAADVVSTGDAVVAYCAARNLAHHAVRVPVHDPAAANNHHHDRASTFHAPAIPDATLHLITVNPSSPSPSQPPSSPSQQQHQQHRTLLYLHGGGFVHPLNARGQLPFAHRCAESLSSSSPSSPVAVTLAVLEYHLAPARRHPTQLAQALAALRALVVDRGVPPAEVVLMGDSAGGNLLLGVLAALKVAAAGSGRSGPAAGAV
ncbi:hypothetical protein SLS58_011190 [Diplodia intermedia]|uniref:Alpha/beta hydrolase fold-3 domain-containing protein n=1 Tax=Diplodia intermedia TaxID=856260 RepID=A0ABR3T0Q8_9PEZI